MIAKNLAVTSLSNVKISLNPRGAPEAEKHMGYGRTRCNLEGSTASVIDQERFSKPPSPWLPLWDGQPAAMNPPTNYIWCPEHRRILCGETSFHPLPSFNATHLHFSNGGKEWDLLEHLHGISWKFLLYRRIACFSEALRYLFLHLGNKELSWGCAGQTHLGISLKISLQM